MYQDASRRDNVDILQINYASCTARGKKMMDRFTVAKNDDDEEMFLY